MNREKNIVKMLVGVILLLVIVGVTVMYGDYKNFQNVPVVVGVGNVIESHFSREGACYVTVICEGGKEEIVTSTSRSFCEEKKSGEFPIYYKIGKNGEVRIMTIN